jgi:hypothetical protein
MKLTVRTGVCAALSAALLLASVGAGVTATGRNTSPGKHAGGVGTLAVGVSGFAVVDADGTLARKVNAKSVDVLDDGEYIVHFNSNVKKCAYTGNVSLSGDTGTPDPGYITLVGANGDPKSVYVSVYDSGGTGVNNGFTVLVTC